MMKIRWTCTLVIAIAASATSFGQDASEWVGQLVITKPGTLLQVERHGVNADETMRTYRVEHAKDGWLWLNDGEMHGWVPAGRVVSYEQAIPYYDQILRDDPRSYSALARRGALWAERGDFRKSEADYAAFIKLRPGSPVGYSSRGVALREQGRLPEAIADFTFVIKHWPDNVAAYLHRGSALFESEKTDDAIADMSETIRLDPKYRRGVAFEVRGSCYMSRHEPARALEDFTQRARLDPKNPIVHHNLGVAHLEMKDYSAAIEEFTVTILLKPDALQSYLFRGSAWALKGNHGNALKDFESAGKIDPTHVAPLRLTANLLATCPDARYRDGARAVSLATRACNLDKGEHPGLYATLAAAYAEAGNFDAAAKWQQKAIDECDPSDGLETLEDQLAQFRRHEPIHEPYHEPPATQVKSLRYSGLGRVLK